MPLPQFTPKPPKSPIEEEKERLEKKLTDISYRIGIHAGKGGVGKTFVTTQLALYAAKRHRVGVIDADIDCPNVPTAFNTQQRLSVTDDGQIIPARFENIQIVSTGFMQEQGEPLIVRGPIKHRLLTDFIEKTAWEKLDMLLFDFPPGTSDVPLSAMQVANLTGIVIVTTPTNSGILDAERAIQMAKRIGVRIYGIVENMSGETFGEGKGKELAEKHHIPFMCSIPLSKELHVQSETGSLGAAQYMEDIYLQMQR